MHLHKDMKRDRGGGGWEKKGHVKETPKTQVYIHTGKKGSNLRRRLNIHTHARETLSSSFPRKRNHHSFHGDSKVFILPLSLN